MARAAVALMLVVALGVALVVPGCSLREDDRPRQISHDSLPSVLFRQSDDAVTNPEGPVTEVHPIYLQDGDTLVPVPLSIPLPNTPAELPRLIMEKLLRPGLGEESKYKSAIPPTTRLRSVTRKDDVLEIDLSNLPVEGTGQRLAFAQFVFTATAVNGVRGVRFTIEGTPTPVPLDNRASDPGQTITRDDYPKLAPNSSTATIAPSTTTTVSDAVGDL
jgi:hypothetical protein